MGGERHAFRWPHSESQMGPNTGTFERLVFAVICVAVSVPLWLSGFRAVAYILAGVGVLSYILHRMCVWAFSRAARRQHLTKTTQVDKLRQ